MNIKVILIFLLTLVILAGLPTSFARPDYLVNLTNVYGDGSCGTCHLNDNRDGPRTSYGTLFEKQPNHATDASAALQAIGAPPTPTPTATFTPTETATQTVTTTVSATAAPGFGIGATMVGLFALFLLVKRNNR